MNITSVRTTNKKINKRRNSPFAFRRPRLIPLLPNLGILGLLSGLVLLLASCQSAPRLEGPGFVRLQEKNTEFKLTYQDEKALTRRFFHPENGNPYVEYPGYIPTYHIFVFRLTVNPQDSGFSFNPAEASLRVRSPKGAVKSVSSRNEDQMMYLWKDYERNAESLRRVVLSRTLFPDETIRLVPGTEESGFLVFPVPYILRWDRLELRLPLHTAGGQTKDLIFPMDFQANP